jgi:DNA-binding PadR family transcriptional regulator
MLELAILGLLKERAMHGYELRKQLAQRLGFFWSVSFGSIYPTLKRLERRGLIEKFSYEDSASRRKQTFRITEAGEREFMELIAEGATSAWEEEKFPLRLAFFRYLKPESRIRLMERRKAALEDKLAEGRRSIRNPRGGWFDEYTMKLIRHGLEVAEQELRWLDELIATERAAFEPPEPEANEDSRRTDDNPQRPDPDAETLSRNQEP